MIIPDFQMNHRNVTDSIVSRRTYFTTFLTTDLTVDFVYHCLGCFHLTIRSFLIVDVDPLHVCFQRLFLVKSFTTNWTRFRLAVNRFLMIIVRPAAIKCFRTFRAFNNRRINQMCGFAMSRQAGPMNVRFEAIVLVAYVMSGYGIWFVLAFVNQNMSSFLAERIELTVTIATFELQFVGVRFAMR